MFKKPEEVIIAILGIAWIILSYFITHWIGTNSGIAVEIIIYTLVWVIGTFIFWKNDKIYYTWPIFIGLFVGSWTPLLTWYAQVKAGYILPTTNLICSIVPWYASWYAKFGLIAAIVLIGYIILIFQNRKK